MVCGTLVGMLASAALVLGSGASMKPTSAMLVAAYIRLGRVWPGSRRGARSGGSLAPMG